MKYVANARAWWAFFLLALLPLGCTRSFIVAVGPNQDVSIFSDFPVGDARLDLLRGILTRKVETPVRPESPFHVERADSNSFSSRRSWRNLAFLGDMTSHAWVARRCRQVVGEDRVRKLTASPAGYTFIRDAWADGQTILFVHAASRKALADLFEREGESLVQRFGSLVIEGLKETLFLSGEHTVLADGIYQRHGYRIRIPKDFLVEEQTENRFVRIKRVVPDEPVMFLFIYYQEHKAPSLNPNLCMAIRDTLAAVYFGHDRIEPSRTTVKHCRFLGRDAFEIYGLYQNLDPPMGGPFKMFCFLEDGRLYLIDLAVFNPPGDKTPQMRILEAVARTFETDQSL
ncbi:MAG: DUF4837 family protein [Candidatus Eisenbacteria sp.]|nr:DUF4837 family protein [Candidatus Eisenbacteria bacterium]